MRLRPVSALKPASSRGFLSKDIPAESRRGKQNEGKTKAPLFDPGTNE